MQCIVTSKVTHNTKEHIYMYLLPKSASLHPKIHRNHTLTYSLQLVFIFNPEFYTEPIDNVTK